MDVVRVLIDFVLHIDVHLDALIAAYGAWVHAILFVIVFCETGLVVMPFLPGDSLLFAAGAFAARGSLDLALLLGLLSFAAIIGDTVNYCFGNMIGPHVFTEGSRFFKKEYLDRAHTFYAKYGKKAIVLARFVPIVRTFVPFVAGAGSMRYRDFLVFNVLGGTLWVFLFTLGGYFFGNIPAVRERFTFIILAIILLSVIPIAAEYWRARKK